MTEKASDTVSVVGWSARQHIEEACREIDRFHADLHPNHVALSRAHALIAQAKLLGLP